MAICNALPDFSFFSLYLTHKVHILFVMIQITLQLQPQSGTDTACTFAIADVAFQYIVALDTYITVSPEDVHGFHINAAGRPKPPPPTPFFTLKSC
jgi:Cu/Zn superoxide dismutase